jgi:hypothetical protein
MGLRKQSLVTRCRAGDNPTGGHRSGQEDNRSELWEGILTRRRSRRPLRRGEPVGSSTERP